LYTGIANHIENINKRVRSQAIKSTNWITYAGKLKNLKDYLT
jgi:hypothetical protein